MKTEAIFKTDVYFIETGRLFFIHINLIMLVDQVHTIFTGNLSVHPALYCSNTYRVTIIIDLEYCLLLLSFLRHYVS